MPQLPPDPVVLAPTPMPLRADDAIDHDALARNVERWNRTRLSGFVVGSAGGEEDYLSADERVAAVRTVAGARAAGKLVVGGIDEPGVTETVRLANAMAAAGADLVRVRIPQTAAGGNRGNVIDYYEAVAAAIPVPIVVIHQTWGTGGFAASPEEIGAICQLDGVVAYIFWHNVRYESYVRRFVPEAVRFWTPNGSLLLPGVVIGATGVCCFFANWAPHLVAEVLELAQAGRLGEAQAAQQRLVAADFLGMTYGVRALKAGLTLLGYEGTVPRRPVPPLGETETADLAAAFVEAGLLDG